MAKGNDKTVFDTCFEFYPEDTNKLQRFPMSEVVSGSSFRVSFNGSTDFFGRITVYHLKLMS